jgi:putative DNA primase/helicase
VPDAEEGAVADTLAAMLDEARPYSPPPGEAEAPEPESFEWGDPEPLVEVFEREPYPVYALPDGIREAVTEAASFLQCPVEMTASSALSALSLAAQGLANVARSDKLMSPVSLYLLQAVGSGERKSAADSLFTASIEAYEREERENAEVEIKNYLSAKASWEARKLGISRALSAAAKKGDPTGEIEKRLRDLHATEPVKPRILQLLHENITTEGLAWALHTGWPTAAALSPEAGVVFGGHAMRAEAIMANLSIINKLWDGATQPVTRRGEGGSYTLRGARFTLGLAAQPDTIRKFLDKTRGLARGSGFLSRCLLAWPATTGARPYKDEPDWKHLPVFNARILRLLKGAPQPDPKTGQLALETLRFTPDGKAVWIDFYNKVESGRAGDELYAEIKDLASKAPDNAARLAALFHLFAHHGRVGVDGIDADTAGRAAIITGWYLDEAKRFLSGATTPPERRAVVELDEWLIRRCCKYSITKIPAAEVSQSGPNALRTSKERDKALGELRDVNRARMLIEKKRKWVEINPKLLA